MFKTIFKRAQAGLVAAAIMGLGLGAGIASAQDLGGPTTTTFSFGSTAPIANPYTDVASGFTYTYSGGTFGSDSGGGDGGTSGIFGLDQGANETIRIDYSGDNFDFVSFWYDNQGGSVNLTVTGRNASNTVVATQTFTGITGVNTLTLTDAGFNSVDHVIIQATTGTGFNSGVLDTFAFDAPSAADTDAPVVQSIAPTGSPADNAASMQFRVTFDESAENVSTNDFALTTTGTASGTIASVSSSSGTTIDVTVSSITGTGTLRLDLNGSTDIADAAANTPPAAFNSGTAHTVDRDAPSGYSVTLDQDPVNAGNDNAVSYTFAGAEAGASYNYTITSSGGAGSVSNSGVIATATDQITGIDVTGLPDGTLTLSVTLTDAASNTGSAATDTATKETVAPSGYSVSFDPSSVGAANDDAVAFTFAGAEAGATYNYTITSSGGAGSVSNSGVIATATDQITGIDVTGLPDGTLTLSVTLTDTNGNTGSAATDTVAKDVAAPSGYSVTLDQDPVNFGNRASISFTFAGAEVGATYIYSITSSGGAGTVTSSGVIATATDQITGIDVRGLTDGTLTLSVTLTDVGGNTGSAATDTATKETVAPSGYSVSFDQASLTAANDDAVSFTFAGAETGATYNYTITSSGGPGSVSNSGVIATATDQITGIDVTGLPDGTLTLSVTLTDINGNVGSAATDTVAKDALAPSGYSVSFDQAAIGSGNANAVSFTFAGAEVGAGYSYSITSSGGAGSVSDTGTISTATDQITSIDVSGLPDGTLTLSVTLTDVGGNTGSAATDTVAKDVVAPTGYSVTLDQDPVNAGNDSAVSFTFAGAEPTAGYSYTITSSGGAGTVSSTGTISTATDQITGINVTGLPDGTLTLSVTLTDTSGNTGSAATDTTTKETVGPSGYSVSFDQSAINTGNASAASFTFASAEVGAGYSYTITSSGGPGSVSNTGTIASATAQITGVDVSGLPDGTLTLSVTLTDINGNTGSATTDTVAKDVAPPSGYSVTLDQDPVNNVNDSAISFTFAGAEPTAGYSYFITSSGGAGSVSNTGTISTATDQITGIDVSGLPDGTLTLSVTLTDASGNAGSAATDTTTKETVAPSGYSVSLDQASISSVNDAAASFTFAGAEPTAGYSYSITSSGGAGSVSNTGTISTATDQITGIDVSGLPDGTLTLSVTLTDANGNVGSAATDTVTKESVPPAVNSITVSGSPAGNASSVAFVVVFNESASNVSTDDFSLTTTGTAAGTIASVSASAGTSITVTVNAISGDGTLRLDLDPLTDIADASGNSGPLAFTTGAAHTVDQTPPAAFGISWSPATLLTPSNQSTAGFAFSGAEVGASYVVTATDSGAATRTASGSIGSAGQTGTINVSGLTDGTLTLTAVLTDPAGNTTSDNGSGTISATKVSSVPSFTMALAPSSVTEGTQATLTYTFDNTAIGVNATGGSLTNTFPAGLVVATPSNVVNGCTGGTTTAVSGTATVSVTGLVLAANSSCTITLDVSANTAASYVNTSGDLTTNLGNSGSASATLTVTQPGVSIADSSVTEGSAGTQIMRFEVRLSEAAGKTVTVDYATVAGTATAGDDFTAASGTLTFNAGESVKYVDVTIINDELPETDEAFTVQLSNVSGTSLSDGVATGQIVTDDADTVNPQIVSIVRSNPVNERTNADTLVWAIEFSEAVTGLTDSSVDVLLNSVFVTDATETITGSGTSYQLTVSGGALTNGNGAIDLNIAAGSIQDAFGNLYMNDGVTGADETYTLDNTVPTVTLAGVIDPNDASQGIVTFTFSEAVTGFDANAIALEAGQLISFTVVSASEYTAVIAPEAGTAFVGLLDSLVFDSAGNSAEIPEAYELVVDAVAPQVTIDVPGAEVEGPFTASFTFTEVVQGFEVGDVGLTNAVASEFTQVNDLEYTALITPDTVGEIVISIVAGALTDLAGNDNEAASVSVQAIAGEIEVSFEITDNVENVTDISGEVDITNPGTQPIPYEVLVDVPWIGVSPRVGTIPSLGTTQLEIGVREEADDLEPGTYVGTIQVVVDQPAGTASVGDSRRTSLNNGAVIVEIPLTIVIEERFGTIEVVSTVPATTQTQEQFDLTSSDEDFNGLSLTPQAGRASSGVIEKLFGTYDVTQSIPAGWRIESISCAGDTDGGTVTDTASGRLDIDLDPGEAIICTIENVRDEDLIRLATQRAIRNFMIRRADRIIEAAPDLSERLSARDQSGAGTFSANVDGGRYNMAFKASLAGARNQAAARNQGAPGVPSQMRDESGLDVWFSAEMAGVTDNRADERAKSDFGVAQLGVDWAVNDDLLIGLLAQYDWMDEHADEVFEQAGAIAGAEVNGEGWMAGPYLVWRLADSLVFDGLAMYGTSDNQVNPLGFYEDDFETERYLLQANLTGEFTSGNWALRPQATLSHYEDEQQAYTDSLGILIPGQTVTLGRLAAGPEVVWQRDRVSGGFWQVSSRLRAVWDYNPAELLTETGAFSGGDSNLTADGELGFGARFNNGAELEFQLRMSGIGDGDFEANSARINLRMPLSLMH